jgi:hypothetical protein
VKLRCKDGDVAVVTWDYADCFQNIGRMVKVRGPVDLDHGLPKWAICPLTPEIYAFRELDGSLGYEYVTWESRIQHPDDWMIPIEPGQDAKVDSESPAVSAPAAVSIEGASVMTAEGEPA